MQKCQSHTYIWTETENTWRATQELSVNFNLINAHWRLTGFHSACFLLPTPQPSDHGLPDPSLFQSSQSRQSKKATRALYCSICSPYFFSRPLAVNLNLKTSSTQERQQGDVRNSLRASTETTEELHEPPASDEEGQSISPTRLWSCPHRFTHSHCLSLAQPQHSWTLLPCGGSQEAVSPPERVATSALLWSSVSCAHRLIYSKIDCSHWACPNGSQGRTGGSSYSFRLGIAGTSQMLHTVSLASSPTQHGILYPVPLLSSLRTVAVVLLHAPNSALLCFQACCLVLVMGNWETRICQGCQGSWADKSTP